MSTDGEGEVGRDVGREVGDEAPRPDTSAGQDDAADEPGDAVIDPAPRAVFRPSPLVVLVAFAFAFCATPFAFGAPLFWLIYLVPVAMIVWAVRTRTIVDPDGLTVRRVLGRRTVPWSEVSSLRLTRRTRVRAVLNGGAELTLPAVHVRNLPALSAASGGHLPDPSAAG
jgi:hypothetical protein